MKLDLPETTRVPSGLTVVGASPDLLAELLETYDYLLRKEGVDTSSLSPGVAASVVEAQLAELGLTPPEELLVWWGWRNGLPGGKHYLTSLDPLPIEASTRVYRRAELGTEWYQWNPSWLRIAGDEVNGLAIDCGPSDDESPRVRMVSTMENTQAGNPQHQVVSLCTPVTWWILGLAKGWFTVEPPGFMRLDMSRYPLEWVLTGVI